VYTTATGAASLAASATPSNTLPANYMGAANSLAGSGMWAGAGMVAMAVAALL
jgi:hypothetical protein